MLVALEGPSGAGKTTCCALLEEYLRGRGILAVDINRYLKMDQIALKVRDITHPIGNVVPEREELLLYAVRVARKARLASGVISEGKADVVLLDRYTLSLAAFFRYVRHMARDDVWSTLHVAAGQVEPDLTVLLGSDLNTLLSRRSGLESSRKLRDFERYFYDYWSGFRQELIKVPGARYELDTTHLAKNEVVEIIAEKITQIKGGIA